MSNHPLVNFYFSPLHLLFGLGLLVRVAWQHLSYSGARLATGGALGFAGCCLFVDLVRPTGWALPLACGFCAATAALGLMLMEARSLIAIPGFLRVLGDASYSLYLIHYAVLSAAAKVIYPIWVRHPTALGVPYTLMILIAVAAGLALHLCLERPLLRVLSRRPEVRLHGKTEAG